jgi:hypothetical protein
LMLVASIRCITYLLMLAKVSICIKKLIFKCEI